MTLMARDMARALDPVLLARDCGIEPDPWQAKLLRDKPRRSLLLCSRQSGKSTTAAIAALDTVLYVPQGKVVVAAPSQRQSDLLFSNITTLLSRLDGAPRTVRESETRLELSNGGTVLSLPGTERSIRGIAGVDLVLIDEAARVEDDLLAGVWPMMATRPEARMIALTTPKGKRGWFYEAWTGDDPLWQRVRVPASMCPRISKEFLAEQLKILGAIGFSEEYELEFRDDVEAVFPVGLIEAAFTTEFTALW